MTAADILAACEPESDPDRRGAQVLLAAAWQLHPGADLPELVAWFGQFGRYAAALDPTLAADVARQMGLA